MRIRIIPILPRPWHKLKAGFLSSRHNLSENNCLVNLAGTNNGLFNFQMILGKCQTLPPLSQKGSFHWWEPWSCICFFLAPPELNSVIWREICWHVLPQNFARGQSQSLFRIVTSKLTRLVLFQGTTIRPAGPSQNLPHMESNWREWIAILVLGWCLNLVCNTISFGRRINPNNEEDHLVVENWPICPAVRRKPKIWRKSS